MHATLLALSVAFLFSTTAGIKIPCSETSFKYVGCYTFDWSRFKSMKTFDPFSMDLCEAFCRSDGYNFMGASRSGRFYHCHCGDHTYIGNAEKKSDSSCWSPCPMYLHPSTKTCGGHFLISVYELDPLPSLGTTGSSCDVRNVSFLVGAEQGVGQFSTASGGAIASISRKVEKYIVHATRQVDYHLKSNTLYFVRDDALYMVTLDYKTDPEAAFPVFLRVTMAFAVDWVHNSIYMGDIRTGSIIMVDLYGQNYTTVFDSKEAHGEITNIEVDPFVGKVFWLHNDTIDWIDLNGENHESNLNEPNVKVTAMALDIHSSRLFYAGLDNRDLRRPTFYVMSYNSSGSPTTVKHPTSLLVNEARALGILDGYVYWINWMDVIFRQPVDALYGRPEMVVKVANDFGYVYTIRVMDADLQKEPAENPCQQESCSHFCVSKAGVARCICPNGMALQDNKTCSDQ